MGVGLWAEVLSPVAHAGYLSFLLNLPKPGASPQHSPPIAETPRIKPCHH